VTWEAAGGTIDSNGVFVAGDDPGTYPVIARAGNRSAEAEVTILRCTPVPTPTPSPSPEATDTPTPEPTQPATPSVSDPQGDVAMYASGAVVESPPAGIDIRSASIEADTSIALEPADTVPAELEAWREEGEALLWLVLYQPVPEEPTVFTDWLFSLDLDGDEQTGRPPGSAQINPDLGDDAVLGVNYNPATASFEAYLVVWDPAQGNWSSVANAARFYLSEGRTLIGLAAPRDVLAETVSDITGVTIAPDAVEGRVAALSYVDSQRVIDFFPDRPE